MSEVTDSSPDNLHSSCALSSLVFHMMYSAYKFNKQSDNVKPWHTALPIWNQSIVPCLVLTIASWPAYRCLRRQVRWPDIPISKNFPQFVEIHTVKGFSVVNEAEVGIFWNSFYFFLWSSGCWQFDSGFSAFSKSSWNIWEFSVHVLLKPSLENFEHYFAGMWNEWNCR